MKSLLSLKSLPKGKEPSTNRLKGPSIHSLYSFFFCFIFKLVVLKIYISLFLQTQQGASRQSRPLVELNGTVLQCFQIGTWMRLRNLKGVTTWHFPNLVKLTFPKNPSWRYRDSPWSLHSGPQQNMVNRKISDDLKECALSLCDRGWELEDIIDAILVLHASLFCWKAIFEEHGSFNRSWLALCGCTQIISRAVLTAVHTLYEQDSDLFLNELVLWLAIHPSIMSSLKKKSFFNLGYSHFFHWLIDWLIDFTTGTYSLKK